MGRDAWDDLTCVCNSRLAWGLQQIEHPYLACHSVRLGLP